jgi:hypothetical protein
MADLTIGAFFFAMRSCEYSSVAERGKTKLLTVGNIRFYTRDRTEISHLDPTLQLIAEYVTVTFEDQKNNHKMETRTQQRTGDPVLCPVLAWSNVVTRILASPNTSPATTVNFFYDTSARPGSEARLITQANTRSLLRTTATILGKKKIGYSAADIGTHSLRSGAAMALFLANESVHKIMILGRWSSDAFLVYIRPQVLEWTSGMSKMMVKTDNFFHAPDAHSDPIRSNDKSHRDDPHIPGDSRAFRGPQSALSFFNGPNAASFLLPRLHLFH